MKYPVKPLSIGVALRQAWIGFKNNLSFYLLSILIVFLVQFGYSFLMDGTANLSIMHNPDAEPVDTQLPLGLMFAHYFGFIAYIIFLLGFLIGMLRASIVVIRGGTASFSHYFRSPNDLWRCFLGYILYFFIILGGLILLVFPAIIWGVKYSLFPYLIADKHVRALDSLKLSSQATMGAKWDLFGFYLIIQLFWLAAALTIGLGLFIVTPLWALTKAAFYVSLTKEPS